MILMIYKSEVFKEYILPNTDNEDYSILLEKELFNMKDNIELQLDITDKHWKIYDSVDYQMFCNGETLSNILLEDGLIINFKTASGERFQGIVVEAEQVFHVTKKYDVTNLVNISIGKDQTNLISYQCMELISKNHGALVRNGGDFYIEDYSANGIFVNSRRISKRQKLHFGDVINIFGLTIVYLGNVISIGTNYGQVLVNENCVKELEFSEKQELDNENNLKRGKGKINFFNRSPRNIPIVIKDKVEIEAPPTPKRSKRKPLLYVIGPAFTMSIPMILGCVLMIYGMQRSGTRASTYMYTGIITAIGSAIIGGVWAYLNVKYEKRTEMEDEQERFNAYGNYLVEIVEDLKKKYEHNALAILSMYPEARECCRYDMNNTNLWNRNYNHSDFLFQRLGIGNIPFQVEIEVPKEKFSVLFDNLKDKPKVIKEEFKELKNVPVGISLNEKPLVGIIGGARKEGAMSIVYQLVAQIAANNCYTDVKLVFAYREKSREDKEKWDFARWLPHVWSEDKSTRYIATNKLEANDVFYELTNVLRRREEEKSFVNEVKFQKPYYVVFIEDASMLEDQAFAKYVYNPKDAYGITTFILAETHEGLPNACEEIIQNDNKFKGMYNAMDSNAEKVPINFDSVFSTEVSKLARTLADVQVKENENNTNIPNQLTFLEMYGIRSIRELHVLERWRKNRTYNTMKVLIGKKAGNADCYLDIHEKYHGPHGLIAGTTGSGKSETLQTYMLSLAINYSPYDVAFFVIDFKGGGMANLFSNLPHMVGQISNLSGNQVRRAMISIKSENRRRQRLFTEHGVNNINLYTNLYKNGEASTPIPHLLIIIDEFAELKREEPDFMRELISVAQVGRSLGVHLILATQKPSGTVDDNIWSNSKFRLCLRVQDRQDSNDMLHKPDAAYITQAGRCYMQIGNDEIYELFQSGYSGAIYDENDIEKNTNIATMLTNTGKNAVVGSRTKIKRKEEEKFKWYSNIVKIIVKKIALEGYREISQLDKSAIDKLIKNTISEMNESGLDYSDNKSNVAKMNNLISLIPENCMEVEDIVSEILNKATRAGVLLPEAKEKTQLDAVIEYLNKVARSNGYENSMGLWLPVLPEELLLEQLEYVVNYEDSQWENQSKEWNLNAVVGLYDDPENQSQLPVSIDFAENGHCAVCGSIVTGKSTFLQTAVFSLINKYSPEMLNLYILDFSSHLMEPFKKAPHVGGIMYENSMDKIDKFFNMMRKIMEERKQLFQGGNYSQYVRAKGIVVPSIVIVVDNIANFREKTNNIYDDMMVNISREGVGYGIFLLISASGFGLTEIPSRVGDNIKNVIALNLGDKFKYMEIMRTTSIPILPEDGVRGRGLVNVSGNILEFQTALSLKAEDDYERANLIENICNIMSQQWVGKKAREIPEIPENPGFFQLSETPEYKEQIKSDRYVPFGYKYQDASICGIDLSETYCYTISGKARTGKTNILKLLIEAIAAKKERIVVIEKGGNELKRAAEETNALYVTEDKEIFNFFKNITDTFKERNVFKQQLIQKDISDNEIFDSMSKFEKIHIFVADVTKFIESIYNPQDDVGNMSGFLENITEKGVYHNIFFYGCVNPDESSRVIGYKAYDNFVNYKSGIHLGGNLAAQRIFNFSNIPYTELTKATKKGMGLIPSIEDESIAEKVIIPLVGR